MKIIEPGIAETSRTRQTEPFAFTGDGKEYFGIWIVNLLLTIVTLGIYSAWAKVRRLQYFYRNTSVAGASFDYHGSPQAILKGRVVAVILLAAYNLSFQYSEALGLAVLAVLAMVMPWLLVRSLRFKLHNSSYRGLRFRFRGSVGESYVVFLILPIASIFTLYLLAPVWHQQLKKYQHNNSCYADAEFRFDAPVGAFYRIYLAAAAMGLAPIVLAGMLAATVLPGMMDSIGPAAAYLAPLVALAVMALFAGIWVLLVKPYLVARIQNLVWNNTGLGPHRFACALSARKLFAIHATNLLLIVLTLGLYKPFAAVRLHKYMVESMALLPVGDLESFVAGQTLAESAAGEETADLFDIDIAL
mgnify:CR=1 FL=1